MSDEMEKAKKAATQADADTKAGVISLTGKPLEGEALARFQKARNASTFLKATYNEDGTMTSDTKKLVE
jgi:hypothetical protein